MPIHFLKVIQFSDEANEEGPSVPAKEPKVQLFLFCLFESLFAEVENNEEASRKKLVEIFDKGLPEKHAQLAKNIS